MTSGWTVEPLGFSPAVPRIPPRKPSRAATFRPTLPAGESSIRAGWTGRRSATSGQPHASPADCVSRRSLRSLLRYSSLARFGSRPPVGPPFGRAVQAAREPARAVRPAMPKRPSHHAEAAIAPRRSVHYALSEASIEPAERNQKSRIRRPGSAPRTGYTPVPRLRGPRSGRSSRWRRWRCGR